MFQDSSHTIYYYYKQTRIAMLKSDNRMPVHCFFSQTGSVKMKAFQYD